MEREGAGGRSGCGGEGERGGTGECSLICQQEVWIGGGGEGWLGEYRC